MKAVRDWIKCPECKGSGSDPEIIRQRNVNYVDTACRTCWGIGRLRAQQEGEK